MKDQMAQWEELIRSGAASKVAQELNRLNISQVNRRDLCAVANFARRVGLPQLTVRALNPIVRDEKNIIQPATPLEKSEYAVGLLRIGVIGEARRILDEVSPNEVPNVGLYRSFANFAERDAQSAVVNLESFLSVIDKSSYMGLVGQVNLASALIGAALYDQAELLLKELVERSSREGKRLLYSNCFELLSQVEIGRKNFSQANEYISKGLEVIGDGKSVYEFFLRKNQLKVKILTKENSLEYIKAFREMKAEAKERGLYESVRDLDYYRALALKDEDQFWRVYIGTPYASYRRDIVEEFRPQSEMPSQCHWVPEVEIFGDKGECFDVAMGTDHKSYSMKPKQKLHVLLETLCSDFYMPFRLTQLFSKVMPEEYYDPETSPDKIYQLVMRLRRSFKSAELPIELVGEKGHYRMSTRKNYALLVPTESHEAEAEAVSLNRSRRRLGKVFGAKDLASVEAISHSKANLIVRWGLDKGCLKQLGSGPKSRYLFAEEVDENEDQRREVS